MVFSRNPEREARLLEQWREGTSARDAAPITGIPEGTVYYYYRKFNRDPEKANRLAKSLKPNKNLTPIDVLSQVSSVSSANFVDGVYEMLVKAGKIFEASEYLKAERERRRTRREIMGDVNSFSALFLADPEKHEALIPEVAREWVRMEMQAGHKFLEAIQLAEKSLSEFILHDKTRPYAMKFGLEFEAMKKEYKAKQRAQKQTKGETAHRRASQEHPFEGLVEPRRKVTWELAPSSGPITEATIESVGMGGVSLTDISDPESNQEED